MWLFQFLLELGHVPFFSRAHRCGSFPAHIYSLSGPVSRRLKMPAIRRQARDIQALRRILRSHLWSSQSNPLIQNGDGLTVRNLKFDIPNFRLQILNIGISNP